MHLIDKKLFGLMTFMVVMFLFFTSNSYAATVQPPGDYSIDGEGNYVIYRDGSSNEKLGDFYVFGVTSPIENVGLDVLNLYDKGRETNSAEFSMIDIYNALSGSPIRYLSLGFLANETGPAGPNYVYIENLEINLYHSSRIYYTFSLDMNDLNRDNIGNLSIDNYNQGASTSEAVFIADLGFDLLEKYLNGEIDTLKISTTISGKDAGKEVFYISSLWSGPGFDPETNTMVPIPSSIWILGAGILGLVGIRRKLNL
jgi:hypothetical protein